MAENCHAFLNIANWPERRVFHWRALSIARAIENQAYMISVNRTGTDGNNLSYKKSSMIVEPSGEILTPIYSEDVVDIYDVDVEKVEKYRMSFPTVVDKQYQLYEKIFRDKLKC